MKQLYVVEDVTNDRYYVIAESLEEAITKYKVQWPEARVEVKSAVRLTDKILL